MTRKQALNILNPDFTVDQIDAWLKELDDEAEDMADKFMSIGAPNNAIPPVGTAQTAADGTFKEGNQKGANQQADVRQQAELKKRGQG